MNARIRGTLAVALVTLLTNAVPAHANDARTIIATAYGRNDALLHYTFRMRVAMAMRHFPWLHFAMNGDGTYVRGERYAVHFTNMPAFAGSHRDIDLSMIDPSMWPTRYRYEEIGRENGNVLFSLQGIDDPALQSATVELSPTAGAQSVDAVYTDGTHLHMTIDSNELSGFLLPCTMRVNIDYPHMPLAADANFVDYQFASPAH